MSAHPQYWKVKASFLSHENAKLAANATIAQSHAQLCAIMRDAGLNPSVVYELDDAAETITEKKRETNNAPAFRYCTTEGQ